MESLAPTPTEIRVQQPERQIVVAFEDGRNAALSFEFLRVYSPSAEVRGHSEQDAVLQVGKRDVRVEKVQAVGNYAVSIFFDDGHSSGIYTWEWLYELVGERDAMWERYLGQLEQAGASRDPLVT